MSFAIEFRNNKIYYNDIMVAVNVYIPYITDNQKYIYFMTSDPDNKSTFDIKRLHVPSKMISDVGLLSIQVTDNSVIFSGIVNKSFDISEKVEAYWFNSRYVVLRTGTKTITCLDILTHEFRIFIDCFIKLSRKYIINKSDPCTLSAIKNGDLEAVYIDKLTQVTEYGYEPYFDNTNIIICNNIIKTDDLVKLSFIRYANLVKIESIEFKILYLDNEIVITDGLNPLHRIDNTYELRDYKISGNLLYVSGNEDVTIKIFGNINAGSATKRPVLIENPLL
jgi:hypothetical protein